MPRYFFGYLDAQPELEGEELADDNEAAALAVAVEKELARNSKGGRRTVVAYDQKWKRIEVADPVMTCPRCKSRMALSGAERDSDDLKRELYTFRCTKCGQVETRSVRHH